MNSRQQNVERRSNMNQSGWNGLVLITCQARKIPGLTFSSVSCLALKRYSSWSYLEVTKRVNPKVLRTTKTLLNFGHSKWNGFKTGSKQLKQTYYIHRFCASYTINFIFQKKSEIIPLKESLQSETNADTRCNKAAQGCKTGLQSKFLLWRIKYLPASWNIFAFVLK